MSRSVDQVQRDLDSLTAADFDEWSESADGWERLDRLCAELREMPGVDPDIVAPILLTFLERLDQADLGSPGPVVHLLEALSGYEKHLQQSLQRRPTPLTVWMANRILNASPPDREVWLDFLRAAASNTQLPEATREEARGFLAFQERTGRH
jgi:hypothetical protein